MGLLITLILRTLSVLAGAYLLPGVFVDNWKTAIIVAIVLGLLNTVLKPILHILALPITLLTLGLFTFIINGFVILVADKLIDGFTVDTIWQAILFSILLTIVNWILDAVFKDEK